MLETNAKLTGFCGMEGTFIGLVGATTWVLNYMSFKPKIN